MTAAVPVTGKTTTAGGDQLQPLVATDISVQREVLTLSWADDLVAEVDVYYEFLNPGARTTVPVGFVVDLPLEGDSISRDGGYSRVTDFTVVMNDQALPVTTAVVAGDTLLDAHGRVRAVDFSKYGEDALLRGGDLWNLKWKDDVPVAYVYYFQATFEPGVNVVRHRYRYRMRSAVYCHYSLDYRFSPALRWANRQIDDFTLRIRTRQEPLHFMMVDSLFRASVEPTVEGSGKWRRRTVLGAGLHGEDSTSVTEVFLRDATVEFRAAPFQPVDSLRIFAADCTESGDINAPTDYYTYRYGLVTLSPLSKALYRQVCNLPYAYRGCVFKDRELDDFFRGRWWYIPDADYRATPENLTPGEREWLRRFEAYGKSRLDR